MYNFVVDQAKDDSKCKCVRLYVEKTNETAIAVYEKMGMQQLDHFNF